MPVQLKQLGVNLENFYTYPLCSTSIGICIAECLSINNRKSYPINLLHEGKKCVLLPYINYEFDEENGQKEFVVIPLLHQSVAK